MRIKRFNEQLELAPDTLNQMKEDLKNIAETTNNNKEKVDQMIKTLSPFMTDENSLNNIQNSNLLLQEVSKFMQNILDKIDEISKDLGESSGEEFLI